MNVSSASSTQFAQQYSTAVASKQLDQQKQDGQKSLSLISSAAPPPKAGHSLSVFA